MSNQTNKDNTGATALLVALFLMLLAGIMCNPAIARSADDMPSVTVVRADRVIELVVTAPRLH